MSSSYADEVAYRTLRAHIQSLDNQIHWDTDTLVGLKGQVIDVDGRIDKLKRERTALKDALAVHFPEGSL